MGKFNFKKNTPSADIGSFRHYIKGVKKVGKTTLFRDLILEQYGAAEFGLLISLGRETGYKALADLYAMEAKNWSGFVSLIDELVLNRGDNKFRIIALDTVDELVAIATEEAFAEHKRVENFEGKSMNSILGGYGAGSRYVQDIINEQVYRLEEAGYGLIFIGHTRVRDIKPKGQSDAYQILGSNLSATMDSLFADKADIIAVINTEREVKAGQVKSAERFIWFRNDTFVDCGTRFANMPEKVVMSAKNYIAAFNTGVKSALKSAGVDTSDLKSIQDAEETQRTEDALEYIEAEQRENVMALVVKLGGRKDKECFEILSKYAEKGDIRLVKKQSVFMELKNELDALEASRS